MLNMIALNRNFPLTSECSRCGDTRYVATAPEKKDQTKNGQKEDYKGDQLLHFQLNQDAHDHIQREEYTSSGDENFNSFSQ